MTIILVIVVGIIVIGAGVLIVVGLRNSSHGDPLQERLAEFAARGEQATLEEIELSQPITDRIILPVARQLGELAIRFTPQNALQATARKLELAGNPRGLRTGDFLGITHHPGGRSKWGYHVGVVANANGLDPGTQGVYCRGHGCRRFLFTGDDDY